MIDRVELNTFSSWEYYSTVRDESILDEKKGFAIKLSSEGKKLISNYYSDKYHTDITFLITYNEIAENADILSAREKKIENYRKAFIVGDNIHSELIVYLKEKDNEAFLHADSRGFSKNALDLYDSVKTKIFVLENARQSDFYSCHTDALVMARDITAKDAKSNEYNTKNLLSTIEKRSQKKSKLLKKYKEYENTPIFEAIIPDVMLKTAQIKKFIDKHKEQKNSLVHKKENLINFLNRYHEQLMIMSKSKKIYEPKKVARYLVLKGRKYADIIEIQFYLEQLKEMFSKNWDKDQSLLFIKNAKATLRSQGQIDDREGLHAYVEKFIENYQEKLSGKSFGY